MSDSSTKTMLAAYKQEGASPTRFLSGMFRSPPRNFYNSEKVEIDITRSDEDIAVAVQDLSAGYRVNSVSQITNKEFTPPAFKESFTVNSFELLKRTAGNNPFQQVSFRGNLISRVFDGVSKLENKIRRANELQASQVLQTGTATLTDADGNQVYTIDYKPKSSHFPTVAVSWSTVATATPLSDIASLARVIRSDGLTSPDLLIMGADAFENFISNDSVIARLDPRRIDVGGIVPLRKMGNGGTFRGTIDVDHYKYDIWTYDGEYKDPETGNKIPFLALDKVIVKASGGRLDAAFGGVPNIGRMLGVRNPILTELPGRIANGPGGLDMFISAWLDESGENLMAGVASRPLYIPTAIDTFGCIDTEI